MYLETAGQRYPCAGAPSLSGETLTFLLPEGGPETLGPTVELYREDGFHLTTLDVSGYLRWSLEGETLTITNLPETEPEPPPEPPLEPVPGVSTAQLVQAIIDLQYEIDTIKLEGMMSP